MRVAALVAAFNVTPVGLFRGSDRHKHVHTHTQGDVHNELIGYLF